MSQKVKVKYHQMNYVVKALSAKTDWVAFSSGTDENWLQIHPIKYCYDQPEPLSFDKPQISTQPRRPINLLSWSSNGKYLASAFDRLTIWEQSSTFEKIHEFKEHSLEIIALTWSPDSTKVATCSLDSKIVIVDVILKNRIREIDCGMKVVGIIWDPFGKYIACLRFDNQVMVWKAESWEIYAQISLNFPNTTTVSFLTSKREDRKIDWSPDFRYLLVPSLDDRVVPVVCALDRHQDFKVCKTFMGPFSSVNVVRFNHMIYQENYSTVFAMGDNDGNISIWRISDKTPEKPLVLLKNISGELIEDIVWSADGSVLFATTMKRQNIYHQFNNTNSYIIIVAFNQNVFGNTLSQIQMEQYLNEQYGGTRSITLQNPQSIINISIPLFEINAPELPKELKIFEKKKTDLHPSSAPSIQTKNNNSTTYTNQQIILQNGKKKIIPQMQIRSDTTQTQVEIINNIQQEIQHQKPQQIETNPAESQFFHRMKQPPLLSSNYIFQMGLTSLVFETLSQSSVLLKCIRSQSDRTEEVVWVDQIDGRPRLLQASGEFVCVYTEQSFIYILSKVGRRILPPIIMPCVAYMSLDDGGNLLIVQENGDFRILQLKQQKVIMEGDMRILMQQEVDPITQVFLMKKCNSGCFPQVILRNSDVYSYQEEMNLWVRTKQLEIQQTDPRRGEIVDTKQFHVIKQIKGNDSFFSRLIIGEPQQRMNQTLNDIQQISQIEELLSQLLIQNDEKQFCIQSYLYVKKLCDTLPLNQEKLHDFLMKLIFDQKAQEYLLVKPSIEQLKKNLTLILKQFPTASQFIYLIE